MEILANGRLSNIGDVVSNNNGSLVNYVYMNRVLVWQRITEKVLYLPQFNNTFNLRSFIDSQDTDGLTGIKVINNHIQPSMMSGDLNGLDVEFVNNGELRGTNSGNTALLMSSLMKLINNGWIRGAGRNGSTGARGRTGYKGIDGAAGAKGSTGASSGPKTILWRHVIKRWNDLTLMGTHSGIGWESIDDRFYSTPHTGAYTKGAKNRMSLETLDVWERYVLDGEATSRIDEKFI